MVLVLGSGGFLLQHARADQSQTKEKSAQKNHQGDGGDAQANDSPKKGIVRVGKLVYDHGKTGVCFADGFLSELARRTDIRVDREFHQIQLSSHEMFKYPFMVMTGSKRFSLSDTERKNLKRYIKQGGFILASAGCSHSRWAKDFRSQMTKMFGDDPFEPIKMKHPLFDQVFQIKTIKLQRSAKHEAIQGLSIHKKLAVVFSPMGLNDTSNAGEGCCCCGGNEVLNAKAINTNVLAYALTH